MRPAALIVIGFAVLASAMLAASDARANLDLSSLRASEPFERVLDVTVYAPAAAVALPASSTPALPAEWLSRSSARSAVHPASAPSSSTRKVTRPPGAHRRHARRHSDPSLRAHHPRANALPPSRRPARPRVPQPGRHAPSPQVRHRDGGTRTTSAPGLPAIATGPLSLAVLGTCANQRDRNRIPIGLEQLEGRGPPRAGPIDASVVACSRGASPHLPRARATHPPGWAPRHRAFLTFRFSSHSRPALAYAARVMPIAARPPARSDPNAPLLTKLSPGFPARRSRARPRTGTAL